MVRLMNLFGYEPSQNILPYDGTVNYFGPVMGPREAQDYLKTLLTTVPWRNDEAIIYGRHIVTARKVASLKNRSEKPVTLASDLSVTAVGARSRAIGVARLNHADNYAGYKRLSIWRSNG